MFGCTYHPTACQLPAAWTVGACLLGLILSSGCGSLQRDTATEQLLMSDAVDSAICQIDFSPISGRTVFLDTTFLNPGRVGPAANNLVNADYVISSIRQQMIGSGVRLVEDRNQADLVCEARLGALGTDGHSVSYGIPQNGMLSAAGSVAGGAPLPNIPELSIAKREVRQGAAKVAVFAYTREDRQPVWQSGMSQANSSARDTWILGAGPFQRGTIYKGTRFAGLRMPRTYVPLVPVPVLHEQNEEIEPAGINMRDAFVYDQPEVAGEPEGAEAVEPQAGEPPAHETGANDPQPVGTGLPPAVSGAGETNRAGSGRPAPLVIDPSMMQTDRWVEAVSRPQ
jgi:hypothetical protein